MLFSSLHPRARAGRLSSCSAVIRTALPLGLVAAAVLAMAGRAQAANRFWITTAGGSFGSTANWSTTAPNGAGGASVPGAADVANFSKGSAYTVTFDADVTNLGLLVNNDNVSFDLGGKTYTSTLSTEIGTTNVGSGRLTLRNGTLNMDSAADQIFVAATGSTGFLTLSTGGRIGNGTTDPNLIIGHGGTATFRIEDNGFADLGFLSIGQRNSASTGTVQVIGPNAVLNTSSGILVGRVGTGTLNVEGAATVAAVGASTLGVELGANGTAKVTGIGSSWTQTGALVIAEAGDAGLTVEAAGVMNTLAAVTIGNAATGIGSGIVTGADSKWNMTGPLTLGVNGLGNFVVAAAAQATTNGAVQMSVNAGSESNVVVTGAGSRWTTGQVTVGDRGKADLVVSAGGAIDTTGNVVLGTNATAVSTAKLTGDGSTWNINGGLNIASLGSATLSVETSSLLNVTGALSLGNPAGSQVGTLNLTGGTLTTGSFTRAAGSNFNWTSGTLLVNGGPFNNGGSDLTINGSTLTDLPILRLAGGAQSAAANSPNLTIGSSRQGQLIVSGGSSFQTTTTSIGALDGSTGVLHVEGGNSSFSTTDDLGVGGTSVAAGGLGGITVGPGGRVTAGSVLRLWGGGTITLAGGTIRFNSLAANGGKFTFNSGTVEVLQNFNADAAALDALVGATRVLGFGRKVATVNNSAFNLQSNLNVAGGELAGNTLTLGSGVVARFESAGAGTFSAGVTNPAGARIYVTDGSLSAGTTLTNSGDLYLSGATATVNGTGVTNTGLIAGSGRINAPVANGVAGQVRVQSGQRLEILGASGSNVNNGLIDVDGGTLEFGRLVTNSNASPSTGMIAARNATLRFHGGLNNSGALSFTHGTSDVFGNVSNLDNLATDGRIIVTGGAQANFFDDVTNAGSIQVSASGTLKSTAVFLGSLSGTGVTGTGQVFIEGDARPGFSPGTMAFGGDVSFGPLSSLNIELAGTTPGTQYDRVTVAQTAALSGELHVTLLNNYRPPIGASFEIVSANGGLSGEFLSESLPELAGGASWSLEYGANSVTLEVGGVLGDFNRDGRVDTADYSVWRDQLGSNSLASDASGNGAVDQADFHIWRANFGQVAASGGGSVGTAAAVPEPAGLALLGLALAAAVSFQRRAR